MSIPLRRVVGASRSSSDADIAVLLERVCARLPHHYTRQLVRDVVRLKLELGLDGDVRRYLQRRSGDHPATPDPEAPARQS